ncbi:MAG: UDP-N-acetylglucosamine 2-epimerase (non-hydrolyzing) [Candidatus Stahlbacteria bacterium]|nr:UDP-N-acetylglucosamine 2-epimerase (non-hydrolyzing) [Candidatus Stahlbacteria bacterium]
MKKILSIIGTRPDAIKMVPVIKGIESRKDIFKSIVVVTAQHRQLLDQVLQVFSIAPDIDLNVMEEAQDLYYITTRILTELKSILRNEKPDLVLVQGDTTTTFVGALAAFYEKIPIGHIEAGLRSHNKYSPYPEEMNRKFTDTISDLLFAPTQIAKSNLLREGVLEEKIWITGNTAIDALFMGLSMDYRFEDRRLRDIVESGKQFILVTAHRRESFDVPLNNICTALLEIKDKFSDIEIIYSVHPNPNVKIPVHKILGKSQGIYLIEPPDYLCFINLMKHAKLILTDSGGMQEEAPSLNKPVLVLREVTERVEGINTGSAILVGTDKQKIVSETIALLTDKDKYGRMSNLPNPYGDGKASERIINSILKFFGLYSQKDGNFE